MDGKVGVVGGGGGGGGGGGDSSEAGEETGEGVEDENELFTMERQRLSP